MSETSTEIRIHWRRYGRGGRWRAVFPPEPGETERGSIESNRLDIVQSVAAERAAKFGWTVIEEPKP